MNLIEKWGSGIPRILQECRTYGLEEPEIIDFNGDMRVNLYRRKAAEHPAEEKAPQAVQESAPAAAPQPQPARSHSGGRSASHP